MAERQARILRGVAAAFLASFVAMGSHILGGGAPPSALGVVATLVLSSFVCVLLAGRCLSLLRLSASVAASQAMFHLLFASSGPPASDGAPMGHNMAAMDPGAMMLPALSAAQDQASTGMMFSHVMAAVVTTAVIHRSERLTEQLVRLGHLLRIVFRPDLLTVTTVPAERPHVCAYVEPVLRLLDVRRSSIFLRGPPAAAI